MLKLFLAVLLVLGAVGAFAGVAKRPFWLIAHRCNSISEIPIVLERGFNGMEIDVQWCNGNIAVDHDFCGPGYTSWSDWLKTVESQPARRLRNLALLILDLKEYSPELVLRLRDDLRKSPKLRSIPRIFSVNNIKGGESAFTREFIKGLNPRVEAIDISEAQCPDSVACWFDSIGVKRQCRWYADGSCAACFGQLQIDTNLQNAVGQRKLNKLHRVYSWTYQSLDQVDKMIGYGLDALVVNTGAGVVQRGEQSYYEWAEEYEAVLQKYSQTIRLARASDF